METPKEDLVHFSAQKKKDRRNLDKKVMQSEKNKVKMHLLIFILFVLKTGLVFALSDHKGHKNNTSLTKSFKILIILN